MGATIKVWKEKTLRRIKLAGMLVIVRLQLCLVSQSEILHDLLRQKIRTRERMASPNFKIPEISVRRASGETEDDGYEAKKPKITQRRNTPTLETGPSLLVPGQAPSSISTKPAAVATKNIASSSSLFVVKWPDKSLESAPEVALLWKKSESVARQQMTWTEKLFRCFGVIFRNRVNDSCGLSNFRPVIARTDKTHEYLNQLAKRYALQTTSKTSVSVKASMTSVQPTSSQNLKQRGPTPSKTVMGRPDPKGKGKGTGAGAGGKSPAKPAPSPPKAPLLKDLYQKSYQTLCFLQSSIGNFKSIIFYLTFTRYSEEALTPSEVKQTAGKSIIGSCIWVVTYALQQLQEDPELEHMELLRRHHPGLQEIAVEMQRLMILSLATWHEMIVAITVIEKMHRKTESLFKRQTVLFQNVASADTSNNAALHIKKYRRAQTDNTELSNLKAFDPYASLLMWSKRHGQSRIIVKTDYISSESLWCGFDPLTVDRKVAHLKDVLGMIKYVLESVHSFARKITVQLQGRLGVPHEEPPPGKPNPKVNKNLLNPTQQISQTSLNIKCYEDGIDVLNETLTKKMAQVDWLPEEVFEFFEADKIFLDDMDLLTLGAGLTRAVLHDARHTMHICYETCRLLEFKEFANLPAYDKIYMKVKQELPDEKKVLKSRSSIVSYDYDIDELHLELRNVAGLFRTSAYHEIVKNLPVYSNRVGLTLQDSDLVFTPSSEKLLSRVERIVGGSM